MTSTRSRRVAWAALLLLGGLYVWLAHRVIVEAGVRILPFDAFAWAYVVIPALFSPLMLLAFWLFFRAYVVGAGRFGWRLWCGAPLAWLFLWRFGDHLAYLIAFRDGGLVTAEILAGIAGFVLMAALAPLWVLAARASPTSGSGG